MSDIIIVNQESTKVVEVDSQVSTKVIDVISQESTKVINVVSVGPQGNTGPIGPAGPIANTSSFATTGSNIFRGNQIITGSLSVTNTIIGNLLGSSSQSSTSISSSYAATASYVENFNIHSYAIASANLDIASTDTLIVPFDTARIVQGITYDTNKFTILTPGVYEISYKVSLITTSGNGVVNIWLENTDITIPYAYTGTQVLIKDTNTILNHSQTIYLQLATGDSVSLALRTVNDGISLVRIAADNPVPECPSATFAIKFIGETIP